MNVKVIVSAVTVSFLASSCTFVTGFVNKTPDKERQRVEQIQNNKQQYDKGFNSCIQKRCATLYKKGVVRTWIKGRIVNGVYVPGHYEFVIKNVPSARFSNQSVLNDESSLNSPSGKGEKSAILSGIDRIVESRIKFARKERTMSKTNEINQLMHKPESVVQLIGGMENDKGLLAKIDVNAEVDMFMKYMKNYNYPKAEKVAFIISRLDTSKIKKKKQFPFYMALTRLLLVEHDYDGAYNSVKMAEKVSSNDKERESALQRAVTTAESWGDPGAMYESFVKLGDFYRTRGEYLKAIKEYYLARKIENDPEVDTRIADTLKKMGEKNLSKAFNLDAYINGVVGLSKR